MSKNKAIVDQKSRIIRRLGPFECYQNAIHTENTYTSTTITCRYNIPEALSEPGLHSKLADVFDVAVASNVLQHPMLQVGLIDVKSRKPAWVRLDKVDLAKHIEWKIVADSETYDTAFDEVLVPNLSTGFHDLETQPGWRLVVVKEKSGKFLDVIFVWNHCNTDGSGAKVFHKTLLHHLNAASRDAHCDRLENRVITTTASAKNLPPTQETVGKFSYTMQYAAHTVWKELKPPVLAKDLPVNATWAPIKMSPYKTQYRSLTIPNDTLQNVLAACRAHKTTLTGLLHGITLISLTRQLSKNEAPAMGGGTALNLRRHMPSKPPGYTWFEPDVTMANYVSIMEHKFGKSLLSNIRDLSKDVAADAMPTPALADVMWSVAETVREEIQQKLDLGLKNELVGLMKLVFDWKTYIKDELKKPRTHAFDITNIGVLDRVETGTNEESAWSVQKANFALSCLVFGPVFAISAVSVKGGELCVSVTWQDCAVKAAMGDRLTADIERWLMHAGSGAGATVQS